MRILLLSDIHANREALDAVLDQFLDQVDLVLCLGDIIGYGPDPKYCIERLRTLGIKGVRGNHETGLLDSSLLPWFSNTAAHMLRWTSSVLDDDDVAFLDELPASRKESELLLVHGAPPDSVWEYILQSADARIAFALCREHYICHGHTHLPRLFCMEAGRIELPLLRPGGRIHLSRGRCLINPGSCGLPRDGDNRSSCMVLDPERALLEYHRIPYFYQRTVEKLRRIGAPQQLEFLLSGL